MQRKFGKENDGNGTQPGGQESGPVSRASADPSAARPGRIRMEQLGSTDPPAKDRRDDQSSREPPESVTGAEPIRRKSSVQITFVAKFNDRLTSDVPSPPGAPTTFKPART
ncbi:hypothetical protein TIFTF001_021789 [Ficus carica]|uniref:Uncharacterized protein n=1 Tax=Ficus carica TaxID=3494 RepID=A0AA88DB29_FICCA|nr:hypothetical protein TIFTF001_021789 [Ficus carica]